MAMFSLCSNVESTPRLLTGMTKNRPHLSLRLRPGGHDTEQASRNTWCFAPFLQECISMATLVCAQGTTILTNCEPSELSACYVPSGNNVDCTRKKN